VAEALRGVEQRELGPGCGRSCRQMSRTPAGQVRRSASPVSSVTHAPGRQQPSPSTAGAQSSSWDQHDGIAHPAVHAETNTEANVAGHKASTKPWVAPVVNRHGIP
jgi:hypothetical protein